MEKIKSVQKGSRETLADRIHLTFWGKVIDECPLSFELITRNADPYTKRNFPKESWIFDANIPTAKKYLPEFFRVNEVELKGDSSEQILEAFYELEKAITEYNKTKIV